MQFSLVPVTHSNRELASRLHVAASQAGMVETVEQCCEEARELPLWRPVMIAADADMVGFAMYGLWQDEGERGRVWLDRFFIDERFQGRGYAKAVLPVLMDKIVDEYKYEEIYLSVYESNTAAIGLYRAFGFKFNGELDINGEKVMLWKQKEARP